MVEVVNVSAPPAPPAFVAWCEACSWSSRPWATSSMAVAAAENHECATGGES